MTPAETHEELEYYLDVIQALRQYAYGRKSGRDPFKIAEYKRLLKVLPGIDKFLKNKIDWYDADHKVARLKQKLSSLAVDSGPPVRVEDRQLSPRQCVEEGLHRAINYRAFLHFKISNYEHRFPRWRETLDEILKKLGEEPPPYQSIVLDEEATEQALAAGWFDYYDFQSLLSANTATPDAAVFPSVPAAPESVAVQPKTTRASSAVLNPPAPKPTKHKGQPRAKETKKTKRDSIKQATATVQPPSDLKSDQNTSIWNALLKNRNASAKDVAEWFEGKVPFPPKEYEAEIKSSNPKITTWSQLYRDWPRFRRNFDSSVSKVRRRMPKNKRPA